MRQPFCRESFPALLLTIILLISLSSCTPRQETAGGKEVNTIKIGVYYPLTGDAASFGISGKQGIEIAQAEANKAGGLLGKQIEIIVEDDRGLQPEAASSVQKLIDKDKTIAVLGETLSSNSIAGGQVCQAKGVPMITPSSTNPQVTEVGEYIFRVCFLDDFQGQVMARFAFNSLKNKRVAMLVENSSDYSVGLAKYFREAFEKLGGEVVSSEAYQRTDADFSAQLTSLIAKSPDSIYVPGYYTQVGQIVQQARKLGFEKPILGGDGWDSPTLLQIGKEALNGCYFSNHYNINDLDPQVQTFVNAYKARYNASPDAVAGLAYDAARILFAAISKANSTDKKAIRDAIAQTKNFPGVTGNISISAKRNAVKSAVIVGIENGNYVVKEKMPPNE